MKNELYDSCWIVISLFPPQEVKRLGEMVESLTEQSGLLSGELRKAHIEVDKKTSEELKLQSEVQKGRLDVDNIKRWVAM